MQIALAGIGTEIGKTHACAALCQAFGFEYFKIIQAGEEEDKELIKKYAKNTLIHENGQSLKHPLSPHLARSLENKSYKMADIKIPKAKNLLLECAGGLYSPLDDLHTMIDFISYHKLASILVSSSYLGSINHSILSIKALKARGIMLLGVIFIGKEDANALFIQKYAILRLFI